MIDKPKAIQLRMDGLTYVRIAQILSCSVAWCKKNLKGIRPGVVSTNPTKEDICNRIFELLAELRKL